MNSKNIKKLTLIIIIIVAIFLFFKLNLNSYLNLEYLKNSQENFNSYYTQNPIKTITIFFIIYILTTTLSLPGATILTLASGALFGLITGTIIVSFASTIGATLAAATSRYILKDYFENKFKTKLKIINNKIKQEGNFYLFTLRLIPIFPFFMINILFGLTKIKLKNFYLISQIGMLPGTIIYVNAGLQLSKITNLNQILSTNTILAFTLIGLLPLISKKILEISKKIKN